MNDDPNQAQPFDLGAILARVGNIPITSDLSTKLNQAAIDEGAAYRGRMASEQPQIPETPSFGYGMAEPITEPSPKPQPPYDYYGANLESGRNLSRQSFVDSHNKQAQAEPRVGTLNAIASTLAGRPVAPYNANPSNYRQLTPSEEAEKYRREQSEYAALAASMAPAAGSAHVISRLAQPAEEGAWLYEQPQLPPPKGFTLYHGSPHDYPAERLVRHPSGETEYIVGSPGQLPDIPHGAEVLQDFPLGRVRLDKVGTGEGNQVYSHGWYGAQREGIAEDYRKRLAGSQLGAIDKVLPDYYKPGEIRSPVYGFGGRFKVLGFEKGNGPGDFRATVQDVDQNGNLIGYPRTHSTIPDIRDVERETGRRPGHMYETRINADPEQHFIDWDKPLNEQSQYVKDAIAKTRWGRDMLERSGGALNYKGSDIAPRTPQAAQEIAELGIPGTRYLDNPSRDLQPTTKVFYKGSRVLPGGESNELHFAIDRAEGAGGVDQAIQQVKGWLKHNPNDEWNKNVLRHLESGDITTKTTPPPKATHNFVLHDERIATIVRKYGIPGAIGLGLITPEIGRQLQEQGMANGGSISDGTRALLGKLKRPNGGAVDQGGFDPAPEGSRDIGPTTMDILKSAYPEWFRPSGSFIPKEGLKPDTPEQTHLGALGAAFRYNTPPDARESTNIEDRTATHPSLPTSMTGYPQRLGGFAVPHDMLPFSAAGVQGMAGAQSGPSVTRGPWMTSTKTLEPFITNTEVSPSAYTLEALMQPSLAHDFNATKWGSNRNAPFETIVQPSVGPFATAVQPSIRPFRTHVESTPPFRNGGSITDGTRQLLRKLKNRA